MGAQPEVAIIGAGNSGAAMAAHLAKNGKNVLLACASKHPGCIPHVQSAGNVITLNDVERNDQRSFKIATGSIQDAVGCPIILVTMPSGAHGDVVKEMARHDLSDNVVVVLPSGLFVTHVRNEMHDNRAPATIIASATAPFASRRQADNIVRITRTKKVLEVGTTGAPLTETLKSRIQSLFPQPLEWQTGVIGQVFSNINPVIHGPTMLVRRDQIVDPTRRNPLFYEECMQDAAHWIDGVDAERCAIMRALSIPSKTLLELFRVWYHPDAKTYMDSVNKTPSYKGRAAPDLNHRYITEDVPHIAFLRDIGAMCGVRTPNMDRVVEEAMAALPVNFSDTGLVAHNMKDATIDDILCWLNGEIALKRPQEIN